MCYTAVLTTGQSVLVPLCYADSRNKCVSYTAVLLTGPSVLHGADIAPCTQSWWIQTDPGA